MLLDNIDKELLALLKVDSRKPVTCLAQILGISRQTVQKRLHILESKKVIAGYTIRTGETFNSERFRAQAMLTIDNNVGDSLIAYFTKIPQVTSVYSVAGNCDALVTIESNSSEGIDFVLDTIRRHPQVIQTQSYLLLSQKLDRQWLAS
ncbi:MAG: DNA-binding Lrp family transcriptional regulator [Oceanospirillaceae bacterium]|jgi:DNA-binding Lrp family transcriptional regulator